MSNEMKCPECGGKMEKGQLLDEAYVRSSPQIWTKKVTDEPSEGETRYEIISYRCADCGFIKNYAPSPVIIEEDGNFNEGEEDQQEIL